MQTTCGKGLNGLFSANDGNTIPAIFAAWMGGNWIAGDLLAIELDVAGVADGLFIFSSLAGLHFNRGCVGLAACRNVAVDALSPKIRLALSYLIARLVAVRGA